jgi:macrolide transport system ATP-binding/permease protein
VGGIKEKAMNRLMQDVQYALRQLRKSPGFTITAILTLALGIGANAAIFTLVHAVLLRNLPVVEPQTLVRVGDKDDCCINGGTPANNDYSLFSYDLYKHLQENSPEFEQLAATQAGYGSITARSSKSDSLPKSLPGEFVTGNYFETFGLKPFAGRLLMPTDDVEGAASVAVMSYQTWQSNYARDPSIVGSTFMLNTHPVTIIGITPPGFYGDRMTAAPPDFFIPMALEPVLGQNSILHKPDRNWVYI